MQPTSTVVEQSSLRLNFELAGRRLDLLDADSQVLAMAVLALGARLSDNPLIVGNNTPRLNALGALGQSGTDLREFGRRREGACRKLTELVVRNIDEKGTLRSSTSEALAALLLTEGLVDRECIGRCAPRRVARLAC